MSDGADHSEGVRPDLTEHLSFCRLCFNACSIRVGVRDGRVASVAGDSDSPLYQGYSCV